ncbi:MAG: hypothetical protein MJ025_06785 [Victivallaceae bacterium]|nr:hypothetical protein [Victivallaceae bacterium]
MKPIGRKGKNQYLHMETEEYREAFRRKLAAFHNFMQCGLIAHGIMTIISCTFPKECWSAFGSWMRTMDVNQAPSEWVVSNALRNTLGEFLEDAAQTCNFAKFLREKSKTNEENGKIA